MVTNNNKIQFTHLTNGIGNSNFKMFSSLLENLLLVHYNFNNNPII